jgi:hypothetical protein
MTIPSIVIANLALAALVVAAVGGLIWLAHRLPEHAPRSDERWGTGGDPWVVSDPLPLEQVAVHEHTLRPAA